LNAIFFPFGNGAGSGGEGVVHCIAGEWKEETDRSRRRLGDGDVVKIRASPCTPPPPPPRIQADHDGKKIPRLIIYTTSLAFITVAETAAAADDEPQKPFRQRVRLSE